MREDRLMITYHVCNFIYIYIYMNSSMIDRPFCERTTFKSYVLSVTNTTRSNKG